MADNAYATAADYADAMITARRAKNWLFLLLLLMLVIQIVVFFFARTTDAIIPPPHSEVLVFNTDPMNKLPSTAPAMEEGATTTESIPSAFSQTTADVLEYVTGIVVFLGVALPMVLAVVLLLIVTIMLVGRLIGVSRLTSAFIWCILLIVLLFPWQAFLEPYAFKIPGVLYTWEELTHHSDGANFSTNDIAFATLKWARYVGFPAVALIILLMIQVKSNRGMKSALGESEDIAIKPAETL